MIREGCCASCSSELPNEGEERDEWRLDVGDEIRSSNISQSIWPRCERREVFKSLSLAGINPTIITWCLSRST